MAQGPAPEDPVPFPPSPIAAPGGDLAHRPTRRSGAIHPRPHLGRDASPCGFAWPGSHPGGVVAGGFHRAGGGFPLARLAARSTGAGYRAAVVPRPFPRWASRIISMCSTRATRASRHERTPARRPMCSACFLAKGQSGFISTARAFSALINVKQPPCRRSGPCPRCVGRRKGLTLAQATRLAFAPAGASRLKPLLRRVSFSGAAIRPCTLVVFARPSGM